MVIKHALIVDDSKSARLVLKRMLNDLNLEVDTVESATDAMDYLKDHIPDVIFMDHMMPGMDGFEAVKHIKNNVDTAVIPIMMYTSRGGDVYLSQARALGAVGVIPKTISPVGLKESLFKLGLVKDRRVTSTLQVEDKKIVESKVEDQPLTEAEKQQVEQSLIKKQAAHEAYIDDLRKLMDDQT
ncbi:MAG: response regulator, partial [Gammaproteobacteria bacterium]